MTRFALALALLATSSVATAQYVSLDRQAKSRRVGLRLDFGFPKDTGNDVTKDDVYFRTELYGQFAAAGWGGYISVPFMKDIGSSPIATSTDSTLGNIEVGGYKLMGAGPVDLVARIGLSLPTARSSTSAFFSYGRLTDLLNSQPDIFGLRLSLSPDIHMGIAFLRADIGADLVFDRKADDDPNRQSFATQLRANVGAGVNLGLFALTAEIVNSIQLTSGDLLAASRSAHTLALSTWANLPIVKPYMAFTFPLDEQNRAAYGFAFTLGVEGVIP